MIFPTRSKRLRNKGWHETFLIFPRLQSCGNTYIVGKSMKRYFINYRRGNEGFLDCEHMTCEDFNKNSFKRFRGTVGDRWR